MNIALTTVTKLTLVNTLHKVLAEILKWNFDLHLCSKMSNAN